MTREKQAANSRQRAKNTRPKNGGMIRKRSGPKGRVELGQKEGWEGGREQSIRSEILIKAGGQKPMVLQRRYSHQQHTEERERLLGGWGWSEALSQKPVEGETCLLLGHAYQQKNEIRGA